MSMTKKHFIELAQILRNNRPIPYERESRDKLEDRLVHWRRLCKDIAIFCHSQNPNFDRSRFLSACGIDDTDT